MLHHQLKVVILITNGAGKVEFDFRIPEYRFSGQESTQDLELVK